MTVQTRADIQTTPLEAVTGVLIDAAEHPDQFSWAYLEEGPTVWRVRIGRPAPVDEPSPTT